MSDLHIRNYAYPYAPKHFASGNVVATALCGAQVRLTEIGDTFSSSPTCDGCILVDFQNEAEGKKNNYFRDKMSDVHIISTEVIGWPADKPGRDYQQVFRWLTTLCGVYRDFECTHIRSGIDVTCLGCILIRFSNETEQDV